MLHFEYCSAVLLGIRKTLKKMELTNDHGLRTLLNTGSTSVTMSLLSLASMRLLIRALRRCIMSLCLVYKLINGLVSLLHSELSQATYYAL